MLVSAEQVRRAMKRRPQYKTCPDCLGTKTRRVKNEKYGVMVFDCTRCGALGLVALTYSEVLADEMALDYVLCG